MVIQFLSLYLLTELHLENYVNCRAVIQTNKSSCKRQSFNITWVTIPFKESWKDKEEEKIEETAGHFSRLLWSTLDFYHQR